MGRGRGNKSRGGRGGGRGRSGGRGGGGHRPHQDNRKSFEEIDKRNEKFQRFYDSLSIVPRGADREAFWAALRRELPNSFRFTGSKGHALSVRNNLVERFFPIIREIRHEGKPVEVPTQIPWFPDGLAYTMRTPKNVVRKYQPFKEFQKFLVSETGVGNISRQEHVSMIPPLLLDVRPEHTVLDLCAAPGSKSAQLIEAIHAGEEHRVDFVIKTAKGQQTNGIPVGDAPMSDSGRSTGLLVANDVNYQRAQMLIHQVKRLNSANLIVTNHDATMFPSIELPSPPPAPGEPKRGRYLKFDRILADVPCSGDGTCRKNPAIWKDWSPQNGLGLYITQVRILTRALQLLKVGGRVVYSTCSMNPVENEAVVASAIERCGGVAKVRLLDCGDTLPALVRSQGLTDWSVMSRNGQTYESYAEAVQQEAEDSRIVPGMFAPEEKEYIPLQHCMRVYPHQQDTGGFFIAVLEKLSEIKAKPEEQSKSMKKDWALTAAEGRENGESEPSMLSSVIADIDSGAGAKRKAEDEEEVDESAPTKKAKHLDELNHAGSGPSAPVGVEVQPLARRRRKDNEPANEESFKYLAADHPELTTIYNFYELHPDFPRDRFLVRNPMGDPVKGIYYTNSLVKDILIANEGRGMKFVHAGVKMFMKQDSQGQDICRWRIQTEGLPIIEGWVGEGRVVRLRKKEILRKLLIEMFPKLKDLDDASEMGEIGRQVADLSMGCCLLRVETSEDADGFKEPLTLPLWRSMHSLNLMLPKEDRKAMLLRLFDEDVELVNHADVKGGGKRTTDTEPRGAVNGSVSGEAEAKEVQERIAQAEEDVDDEVVDVKEEMKPAEAIEADAMADEDRALAEEVEEMEDEETKIVEAMPERWGEGDEVNTTV